MVKHFQTICRQQPTNCLSVFDHFARLALKGLKLYINVHLFSQGFKENLHAVLFLAENAVGPKSARPDDIHTLYSGLSVNNLILILCLILLQQILFY